MDNNIGELLERATALTASHWGHCVDLCETVPGKGQLIDEANELINLVQMMGFALIADERGLVAGKLGAFSPAFAEANDNGSLEGERVLSEGLKTYGTQSPDISAGTEI